VRGEGVRRRREERGEMRVRGRRRRKGERIEERVRRWRCTHSTVWTPTHS
jgi:hypothetical protein